MNPDNRDQIQQLKELVPEVDIEVIEVIYEQNANNLEKSLNELLQLSDPNYKPEPISQGNPASNVFPFNLK